MYKAIAGAYLLETHVTGLRAHGQQTVMAIDCNDFKHDSNLTIEVILKVLTLLKVLLLFFIHNHDASFIVFTEFSFQEFICPA